MNMNFLTDLSSTLFNSALSPFNTKDDGKRLNTMLRIDGKNYYTYKRSNGTYYYLDDKDNVINITDGKTARYLSHNYANLMDMEKGTERQLVKSDLPKKEIKPITNSGTSSTSTPKAPVYDDTELRKTIQTLTDRIYELEHPKVYTADELAEHYGLGDQYSTDYWLNLYNDKTNQYFDDAVREQERIRRESAIDQNLYSLDLMDQYNAASKNSVGSSLNRGIRNTVGEQGSWGMAKTNSDNDYGMLQSINQLEQDRLAELANNPNMARQAYTDLGTYLMQLGVGHNKSDVENYYHTLTNYMNNYTTARNASATLAKANAAQYAGLANATGINANTAASSYNNNLYQQLYKMYEVYGNKSNTAYLNSTGYGN